MATTKVSLPENTWTEVATADCHFQNLSNVNIRVISKSTLPLDSEENWKVAVPFEIYLFEFASSENLYAYCPSEDGEVSYDLI